MSPLRRIVSCAPWRSTVVEERDGGEMLWTTVKHGQQQQRGPGCRHALSCLPTWCASRVGRRSLSLQSQSTDGGGEDAVVLGGRASTAEGDVNVFFSGKLANLLDVSPWWRGKPPSPPFRRACLFGEWNGKFCFCSWFAQFFFACEDDAKTSLSAPYSDRGEAETRATRDPWRRMQFRFMASGGRTRLSCVSRRF